MMPFDEQLPGSVEDQDPLAALASQISPQQQGPYGVSPDFIRQQQATVAAQRDSAQEKFLDLFTRSAIEPPDEYVKKRIQDDLFGGQEPTRKGRAGLFLKNILGAVAAGDKFKPLQQRVRENALQEYKLKQANRSADISENKAAVTSLLHQLTMKQKEDIAAENFKLKREQLKVTQERNLADDVYKTNANYLKAVAEGNKTRIAEAKLEQDKAEFKYKVARGLSPDSNMYYTNMDAAVAAGVDPATASQAVLDRMYESRGKGKSGGGSTTIAENEVSTPFQDIHTGQMNLLKSLNRSTRQSIPNQNPFRQIPFLDFSGGQINKVPQEPSAVPVQGGQPQGQVIPPQVQPQLTSRAPVKPAPQQQNPIPPSPQVRYSAPIRPIPENYLVDSWLTERFNATPVGTDQSGNTLYDLNPGGDPRYKGARVIKTTGYKTEADRRANETRMALLSIPTSAAEMLLGIAEEGSGRLGDIFSIGGEYTAGLKRSLGARGHTVGGLLKFDKALPKVQEMIDLLQRLPTYKMSGMQVNQPELVAGKIRVATLNDAPEVAISQVLHMMAQYKTWDWINKLASQGLNPMTMAKLPVSLKIEREIEKNLDLFKQKKIDGPTFMASLDPEKLFADDMKNLLLKEKGGIPSPSPVTGRDKSVPNRYKGILKEE